MLRRILERGRGARQNELLRASALYAVLSVALMWPNLLHLRTTTVYPYGDGVQMIWSSGWVAHAITHFHNPFFSPYLMAPHGTNLLASPCAVGLAIFGAPITLLLGPIATFNTQLFLMPVLSAVAMVYALREIVRTPLARVIGGLVWGFSPFVLSCLNTGWTNIGFVFFPPLLISLVLDELYFHRRSSFRNGVAAGLLTALQITIGSEIVANTFFLLTLCGAPALLVAVVRSSDFRRRLAVQIRPLARGALIPSLLVSLPVVLFTLLGPARLRNWVWDPWVIQLNGLHTLRELVGPTLSSTNPFLPPMAASPVYLGWPMIALVFAAIVVGRRSRYMWGALVIGLTGLWLSFSDFVPVNIWKAIWHLPVVHNMGPIRFFVWVWFAIAVAMAIATDQLLHKEVRPWRSRTSVVAAVVVMVASVVVSFRDVIPVNHSPLSPTAGLREISKRHPGSTIVTFPFAESVTAMVEQARNGFRFYTPGSFGPAAINVPPDEHEVAKYFTDLVRTGGTIKQDLSRAKRTAIRKVFRKWGVDYVVVPVRMRHMIPGFPEILKFQERMTLLYGVPEVVRGSFVWDTANFTAPMRLPSGLRILFCEDLWTRHPERMPACYLS